MTNTHAVAWTCRKVVVCSILALALLCLSWVRLACINLVNVPHSFTLLTPRWCKFQAGGPKITGFWVSQKSTGFQNHGIPRLAMGLAQSKFRRINGVLIVCVRSVRQLRLLWWCANRWRFRNPGQCLMFVFFFERSRHSSWSSNENRRSKANRKRKHLG